ncbi:hypothetical protein AMTRI_Chr08g206520 [Amborella trichopoda]
MFLIFLLLSLLTGKPSAIAGKPFTIYRKVLHQLFYPINSAASDPLSLLHHPQKTRFWSMVSRSFQHLAPRPQTPHRRQLRPPLLSQFRPNPPKHARKPSENRWTNHSRCCCDLATLAVISLLAYCVRKFRQNSGNGVSLKGSRSSRSSSLRLFLAANSGTKVGVSTGSDVIYLGTVNDVSPCQKNIDSPEKQAGILIQSRNQAIAASIQASFW